VYRSLLFFILGLLYFQIGFSQLTGRVVDDSGEPLAYVNIYLLGTTTGTTSNLDGYYKLDVPQGSSTIVYQYLGYKTHERLIANTAGTVLDDVVLQNQVYTLDQVVIAADAEDPAYAIIRKAKEKREYYLKQFDDYSCDVYVKGFNKVTDAPEKIFGRDVGDMEGMIDSTRQGIVYLSESVSRLYVKGSEVKEVLYSSKVSGDPQGYSFNSASGMDFSFYNNTIDFNRALVSPIANNCFTHYDYSLQGVYYENDKVINNIKVIPKNKYGNVVYGNIFIIEDEWNIKSLRLLTTKEATQIPFIDSLQIQQEYHQLADDQWVPLSTVITFDLAALGFGLEGNFAAVYSDFDFEGIDDSVFSNEVYNVLEESNSRNETYWDTIRPIPLTTEESIDYHKKDSIRIVKESPAYLDSVDRAANKFTLLHLITDYRFQNSNNGTSLTFDNPVLNTQVNTIQGWNTSTGLEWNKEYSKKAFHQLRVKASVNYGFSETVWRPVATAEFVDFRFHNQTIKLEVGNRVTQFNRQEPISSTVNSLHTIFFNNNYLKAYDNAFASLNWKRNLHPSVYLQSSIDYESRDPLVNTFNLDEENFTSNDPLFPDSFLPSFDSHDALILRLGLRFRFGREVWRYPDQVFLSSSKWPAIDVFYRGGFQDVDYHLVGATIQDRIPIGIVGQTRVYARAATFLGNRPQYVMDYIHVRGNQTFIARSSTINQYYLLPYYTHSADDYSIQFHAQHQFKGYLMSKIPLLRKTQFQFLAGYKYLSTNVQPTYQEVHVGVENLGFGIARLFRVDAVWSFGDDQEQISNSSFGVLVSLGIDF